MSEKHLYEKHLAEKLQQLSPPPNVEQHWQEMKAMLDDDKPRGGGFGKRWWRLGVIVGILLIGTWITGNFLWTSDIDKRVVADKTNTANVEEKKLSPATNEPGKDNEAADNGKGTTPIEANKPAAPPDGDKAAAPGTEPANNKPLSAAKDKSLSTVKDKSLSAAKDKSEPFSEIDRSLSAGTKAGNKNREKVLAKSSPPVLSGTTTNAKKIQYGADVGVDRKKNDKQYNKNNSTKDDLTVHSNNSNNVTTSSNSVITRRPVDYSPLNENIEYDQSGGFKLNGILLPGNASLSSRKTLSSKSIRAAKARQERSFAFGVSLPLAFPLGDQKALSYNFNAGANTVSDYLPSPHMQYRINKKTYLQTELQFISPQYIRPILLDETRSMAGSYMIYNSVYARKLYYFNLPVGIHYSPFPNFYLGTGLQLSSLLSGVGLYEETKRSMSGQPIALVSEKYSKINDNLLSRMNKMEMRLMLETNYYYNRFTFGLRYNQAFNNYVNFRIDPMSPYTFDKNKALQFYMRYNLWENIRGRNVFKGLSSK